MNYIENYQIKIKFNKDIKILILSKTKLESIEEILKQQSFKLVFEKNLENVIIEDYSLVILNIENYDLKLLHKIKEQSTNLPVIIISKSYTPKIIQEGYSSGANDFLNFPFLKEEVLYKVENILKQEFYKNELNYNVNLMQEYKYAIDKSTIVSKTNPRGIITYVNQAFVDISGYESKELVGKSHNLIKHNDMEDELFKELWKTISSKKTWTGIIKNRKKDGSHYWVKTVINPIIDNDGNIIEFISIRSDVTYIQDLKEKLAYELNVTTTNFKEAYQLANEYEKAIDESNILSRTNTKGVIVYANKEFERVTGYSSKELIGNTHSLVKHPDTPKEVINDLWKTITSGNVWKGLIKNKAKDGNPYWVNSVILPIKDINGKNQEYLSIRNDVTEIINLHSEIESTQKELIYRMGEIAESRSKETGNHIKRVSSYCRVLGKAYGLDEDDIELLYMASPMHDIGKLSTPDSILNKKGKHTETEFEIMKQHSQIGFDLLNSDKPILKAAAIIAHEHHERWDGKGYPRGIKKDEIHIFGRITAIADVFDALGSDRCYKKAWEDERIFEMLKSEKGKQFDPNLIELFFENIDEIIDIRDKFQD